MSNPVSEEVAKSLLILVPKSDVRGAPVKGSGIVGSRSVERPGVIRIDYEGNIYGAANLLSFWAKLFHAADRHVSGYPTVAREYRSEGDAFPYWQIGLLDYPQAIDRVRSRDCTVDEAVRAACSIDLTARKLLEAWVGPLD